MRRLAQAVPALAAGAALALYAATRTWSVQLTERPGLSDLRAERTGAAEMPWLVALALVALAGAGALLATRGVVRRGLGVLLIAAGAALAVFAVIARAGLDPGAAGAGATVWPAACVVGGGLVVLGGLGAARHGREWPTMGSRYERRAVPPHRDGVDAGSGPSSAAGPVGAAAARGSRPGSSVPAGRDATAARGGPAESVPDATAASGGLAAAFDGPAAALGGPAAVSGAPAGSGGAAGQRDDEPVDTRAVWEALDRGEDPTAR